MSETRKKHSKEFKEEALKLVEKTWNRSKEAADLGISANILYLRKKSVEEHKEKVFPGNGNLIEKELHELRKENYAYRSRSRY